MRDSRRDVFSRTLGDFERKRESTQCVCYSVVVIHKSTADEHPMQCSQTDVDHIEGGE